MKVPLRIGAVAEAAGVGVQTLRYYERRGLLSARDRTAAGYREYAPDAVRRVVFIRRAQAMGFTLDEIRALLALRVREPGRCDQVKKSAEIARARVREQLTALRRMDTVLAGLIRACDVRAVTEECPILAALEPEERI
jgi:MerR family mercuric resistance operon transcriptional regulator